MIVYEVQWDDGDFYNGWQTLGLFSTKEKAEEAIQKWNEQYDGIVYDSFIREREVDGPF